MIRRLSLDAPAIAAYRRDVGDLQRRLPSGADSLRRIARAGLQDSWPRAALLSIHARVEDVPSDAWQHAVYAQVWGPRFNAYVVAEDDVAVFTVGRQPRGGATRSRGIELADRLDDVLTGGALPYREAGRALGVAPNALRYAAPTGRIRVRWEGAGPPLIWTVPAPDVDPVEMRRELARRYLHALGPSSADGFAKWAGIAPREAAATFAELEPSLLDVETPIGEALILADDADRFRSADAEPSEGVRLLPGGDPYVLRWGPERDLQVADGQRRASLWTSRVWPGALLVDGDLAGTWRRSDATVTVTPWRRLDDAACEAVEREAGSLPLPGLDAPITLTWERAT